MANRKNILVMSAFWSGIKPFFLEASNSFKGMPAFTNTFFTLLKDENVDKIYVIFFGSKIETEYKIPEEYGHKLKVFGYSYSSKASAFLKLFQLSTKVAHLLLKEKVDVVYSHGPIGGVGAIMSNLFGIKSVRRIYGTFLARELEKTKLRLFLEHPLEYLTFSLPGKALVITNDGTKGNLVYDKIGNKKMPLFFWLNGVDKEIEAHLPLAEVQKQYNLSFVPDICYIARIDFWKRQHLLIDILVELKKRGKCYNALIAGPVLSDSYFNRIIETINEHGLSENVVVIPGMTRQETLSVIKHSKLSVSLYDFSNLGNVFLESLTLGTPMLTENIENSLDLIDKEVYFEIDPKRIEESADTIQVIFENESLILQKSRKAISFSNDVLDTWQERVKKEIDLLELAD